MEIAVVVRGQAHILRALGHGTSMDAEWLALIHALRIAQSLGESDFVLMGDAAAVVAQANGTAKCRDAGRAHLQAFRALVPGDDQPRVRHIKRSQNLAGIALAKVHSR